MKNKAVTKRELAKFAKKLLNEEKCPLTVEKYVRDVGYFFDYALNKQIGKELLIKYKAHLGDNYAPSSANSMISSLNSFLSYIGRSDLRIKQFKIQRRTFFNESRMLNKREYEKLVKTAEKKNNIRLSLIIQTICSTGIRVSELEFITVEAVKNGEATVKCKSKMRKIFIIKELRKKLLCYCREKGITKGKVFITKTGNKISRCNIWREMKALCSLAGIQRSKVFPHNLRHLFARTFYEIKKDIAKLADVLGHSNVNTTRIYIISTGAEHARIIERMHLLI